jgi:signal transduction histidine kinase
MRVLVYLLFFFCGLPVASAQNILNLTNTPRQDIRLLPYLSSYHDAANSVSVEQVLESSHQAQFVPLEGHSISRKPQGHYWLKFTVFNASSKTLTWKLIHEFSYVDSLILYEELGHSLHALAQTGDRVDTWPEPPEHRLPTFKLSIDPGEHTYYLRYDSLGTSNLAFSLQTEDVASNIVRMDTFILGLLFGFLLVMGLYNLFIAIQLRERSYFAYVGYIMSFGLVQFIFSGTARHMCPDHAVTQFFMNEGLIIFAEITAICASAFTLLFLEVRQKHPWLFRIVCVFFGMSAVNIVICLVDYKLSTRLFLISNTYISLTLLTIGIRACLARYRPAYFYLAAWSCLIIGSLASMARLTGFAPSNFFTQWGQFGGGAIELVMLSLALGDKMRMIRDESHTMISNLNSNLNKANAQLQLHIENVEAIVNDKTRDIKSMLKAAPHGIFMISGAEFEILPDYSDELTRIFPDNNLTGQKLETVLFAHTSLSSDRLAQMRAALQSTMGNDVINYELNQSLMAKEMDYKSPAGFRTLNLDWSPIVASTGIVEKILVTVRDVTDMRQLEELQARQRMELEAIGKVLKVNPDRFNTFMTTCMDFLGSCQDLVKNRIVLLQADLQKIFMNLHTMKGLARTYGFDDLATAIHDTESRLEPHRYLEEFSLNSGVLSQDLASIDFILKNYERINTEIIGRKSAQHSIQQNAWLKTKIAELKRIERKNLSDREKADFEAIIFDFEVHYSKNLEDSLEGILEQLPRTASGLGKPPPQIIFENDDVLLNTDGQSLMGAIFVHLFNNAIDHSIELPNERTARGKPWRGKICVNSQKIDEQIRITVRDDGKGLDLIAIHERAKDAGLLKQPLDSVLQLANLIFEPGFSTKTQTTMTSGRGVGMDAVATYLFNHNSRIHIEILDSGIELKSLRPVAIQFVLTVDGALSVPSHPSEENTKVAV